MRSSTVNAVSGSAIGTRHANDVGVPRRYHPFDGASHSRGQAYVVGLMNAHDGMAGEFVTETLEFDGGRQVTAYVPSAPPEAVVFAGDGQLIASWGGVLEAADVPSTLIIGAHRLDDETLRLHEYSPGESTSVFAFDPERFAAHENFFVKDVRRWAQSRFGLDLPAHRTAVCGVSASGELALAMGLRHPDVYGAVLCASPGAGFRPPAVMPSPLPRVYLVAGTQEPFFLANATRWADALRDVDADVVFT
jgi:Putative esterase